MEYFYWSTYKNTKDFWPRWQKRQFYTQLYKFLIVKNFMFFKVTSNCSIPSTTITRIKLHKMAPFVQFRRWSGRISTSSPEISTWYRKSLLRREFYVEAPTNQFKWTGRSTHISEGVEKFKKWTTGSHVSLHHLQVSNLQLSVILANTITKA